jgi:hypothetical protein
VTSSPPSAAIEPLAVMATREAIDRMKEWLKDNYNQFRRPAEDNTCVVEFLLEVLRRGQDRSLQWNTFRTLWGSARAELHQVAREYLRASASLLSGPQVDELLHMLPDPLSDLAASLKEVDLPTKQRISARVALATGKILVPAGQYLAIGVKPDEASHYNIPTSFLIPRHGEVIEGTYDVNSAVSAVRERVKNEHHLVTLKQAQVVSWYFSNPITGVIFGDTERLCPEACRTDRNQVGLFTVDGGRPVPNPQTMHFSRVSYRLIERLPDA